MYNRNKILAVDSYKASQFLQYPPGTEYIYSYIESRGGEYNETMFFGISAFLQEYLSTPITQDDINEAEEFFGLHGEPFNKEGWQYILETYDGYFPLKIRAVDEGSIIPTKNVLVTVQNTDPKCFWLTSYVETALLRGVWYPTTVATQSWQIRQVIKHYLEVSGDVGLLDFKLVDFGARGVSSSESAAIGGMSHLATGFKATDTIEGILAARRFYGETMAGYSIPASEHSTITSWGRDREIDAYRNMIKQFAKPGALFACVFDSYDVYNAADNIVGDELKTEIIDSGAILVFRPDSGNPLEVVSKVIEILGRRFGYTTNDKGYKVLNNVRIIQGDGVNINTIRDILGKLVSVGWSADNVTFGMGGQMLQMINRDLQKFAMKASAICINGAWSGFSKDPITDPGKRSKTGLVTTYRDRDPNGELSYYSGVLDWTPDVLRNVYELVDKRPVINKPLFQSVRNLANS
ncbi:MAG TPA: nicotinate phosphoribosyltransferase [Methanosarcina sp.]|nr:nicotinate phosphoribosyltransferase [Methanosarcina sp.]